MGKYGGFHFRFFGDGFNSIPPDKDDDNGDFDDDNDDDEDDDDDDDADDYLIEKLFSDPEAFQNLVKSIANEATERFLAEDHPGGVVGGIYYAHTLFDGHQEKMPNITRTILSSNYQDGSYGTYVARTLVSDLAKYEDPLLFGIIDDVYLHCTRSYSFQGNSVTVTIRLIWDTHKSPYKLDLWNTSYIRDNKEFVYLLVGDLIEDLVNGSEEKTNRRDNSNRNDRDEP